MPFLEMFYWYIVIVNICIRRIFPTLNDYSKRGCLIIASDESMSEAGGFIKTISKLHLLWGCVADHTLVRMADGSCKQIKDIKIGDRVCVKNGGHGYVEDIIRGREEEPL